MPKLRYDTAINAICAKGSNLLEPFSTGVFIQRHVQPHEPFSKRFSSAKIKADRKFQPQAYIGIPRIEISDQRRDWSKWGVLKMALKSQFLNPYWWRFQWRYRRGKTPWDTEITPPEVMAFINDTPPGTALDLGCGTGTNAITLTRHGWRVTGVDFIGAAIRKARKKAAAEGLDIEFIESSVTELDMVSSPFSYILDIGCLFGLIETDRRKYAANVQRLLGAGGWYMLYAWNPRNYNNQMVGISPAEVDALLGDTLTKIRTVEGEEHGAASTWYWYQRPASGITI